VRIRLAKVRLREAKAIVIQCCFRQRCARYRVRLYRKISEANKLLDSKHMIRVERCGHYVFNGASIVISRGYSGYKIRRGLKVLVYWNRVRLSVIIQRYFRGYVKRKLFVRMKRLKLKEDRRIYHAASLIQKVIRGFVTRQKYTTMVVLADAAKMERRRLKIEKMESDVNRENVRKRREILRALMPFRYMFEYSRAIKIQRVYRGHRGRMSALRNKINTILVDDAKKQRVIIRAATDIQRVWQGYILRRIARKQRRRDSATRIQAFWRGRRARRQIKANRERKENMDKLCHYIFSYTIKLRYHRNLKKNIYFRKFVITIQKVMRKYLARKRVRLYKDMKRLQEERAATGRIALIKALTGCQLMLLYESLNRDIGVKSSSVSGVKCPCLGPIQAIFVSALGPKSKTDSSGLVTNRVPLVETIKLLQRVVGLFDGNIYLIQHVKNIYS